MNDRHTTPFEDLLPVFVVVCVVTLIMMCIHIIIYTGR